MLWLNNQPWSVAGRWVGNLEKSLNIILANPSDGKKFAFFNIPNNYRGAYLARNAIGDIGQHSDVDWKAVEPDDRHSETGQIRESVSNGGSNYQAYYWSDDLANFVPVRLSPNLSARDALAWTALPLTQKCTIIQGSERIDRSKQTKNWFIKPGFEPIMLTVNYQKLQPSSIEFLQMDCKNASDSPMHHSGQKSGRDSGISLLISNALLPTTVITPTVSPVVSPMQPSNQSSNQSAEGNLLFTLRLMPGWFSTNDKSSTVLVIPPSWSGSFNLTMKDEEGLLPRLKRVSKAGDVSARAAQLLAFDVSKIPRATRALLQISRKNQCFSRHCTFDFDEEHSGK